MLADTTGEVIDPMTQLDVLLGGSVFCDLVFAGSDPMTPGAEVYADRFVVTPGGTATRAVAMARLGLRTGLAGVVGRDMFGERVVADLTSEPDLDLRWLRRSADVHTPVTVALTDEHDRSFLTYEQDGTGVPHELDAPLPSARVCNIGLGRPVPGWVRDLRADGTVVHGGLGFDPTQQWSDELFERLVDVDLLCVNEVEAAGYARTDDLHVAAEKLAEHVPLAVVTRGPSGVIAHDSRTNAHIEVPAVPVRAVDPTGAGDNFVAGLALAAVRGWDLETSLRFGTLVAALSVRRLGGAASAPVPSDVMSFVDEVRPAGDWDVVLDWARNHPEEAA